MAGSINKVILIGNLGRSPEIRSTQGGTRVANLRIATSDAWNDKATGERRERTEWHQVVIWDDRLIDVAEKYLEKGHKVYLEGCLRTRKWTDKAGQDRYATEVVLERFRSQLVMLGGRNERNRSGNNEAPLPPVDNMGGGHPDTPPVGGNLNDDIPF